MLPVLALGSSPYGSQHTPCESNALARVATFTSPLQAWGEATRFGAKHPFQQMASFSFLNATVMHKCHTYNLALRLYSLDAAP